MTNIDFSKILSKEQQELKITNQRKQEIADRRYIAEVSALSIDGVVFYNDRETRSLINQCLMFLEEGQTVKWKSSNSGFVELSKQQLTYIAKVLFVYVQQCFVREEVLVSMVDNGTYSTSMLDQGWPDVTISINA